MIFRVDSLLLAMYTEIEICFYVIVERAIIAALNFITQSISQYGVKAYFQKKKTCFVC